MVEGYKIIWVPVADWEQGVNLHTLNAITQMSLNELKQEYNVTKQVITNKTKEKKDFVKKTNDLLVLLRRRKTLLNGLIKRKIEGR